MDMEWTELASQPLPSLRGGGGGVMQEINRNVGTEIPHLRSSVPALPHNNNAFWIRPSDNTSHTDASPKTTIFESVEDRLARHEEELHQQIINQTAEKISAQVHEAIEKQLAQAWDQERELWMKELIGTRTLGGSASRRQTTTSNVLALQPPQPQLHPASSTPSWTTNNIIPYPRFAPMPLDPAMVQAHLEVMKESPTPEAFLQLIRAHPSQRAGVDSGYRAAWQLAAHLIRTPKDSISQAVAILTHLCHQFRVHVMERVRSSASSRLNNRTPPTHPQHSYKSDTADQCTTYVRLIMGNFQSSPYAVLYYCLRCGDAVAAHEIMEQHDVGDPPARNLVQRLARAQGKLVNYWEAGVPRLSPFYRTTVASLIETAKDEDDIYKVGFLTLVAASGQQLPTSDTITGFTTIEDYLTAAVGSAVCADDPEAELIKLGEEVQGLGAEYFRNDESEGWSFALPLLVTQQWEMALRHLCSCSSTGILQAAHLGLVLAMSNKDIYDLGHENRSESFLPWLMVAYADQLLAEPNSGAVAALEYLGRIPDKPRAIKEVATLITKTGDLERLVGTVDAEGMRQGGETLDRLFRPSEVEILLGQAGGMLLQEGSSQEKAATGVMCYMLGGRYADVLRVLTTFLSPPDRVDEKRQFWMDHTEAFHKYYTSKRTHVMETLENRGESSAVETNRTMLSLNKFFQLLRGERTDEALSFVEELRLLPVVPDDLAAKEAAYNGLDSMVKAALPAVLVGSVDAIYRQISRIKQSGQSATSQVARGRLEQLKQKAQIQMRYAGRIRVSGHEMEALSRLEALLV